MNKILSNMMLSCTQSITIEQTDELQKFKAHAPDFNYKQAGYAELLNFDLEQHKPDP